MQNLRLLRDALIALVMLVAMTSAALAVDDDDAPAPEDDICAGLTRGAQGLCNAYCKAQNCPDHPEKHSCVVLRRNFARQTGLSTFPCDGVAPLTATPSSTRTATVPPPTRTPTNTPGATGTATATLPPSATASAPATSTATPAATATGTGLPTFTATTSAEETATAVSTATATPVGVPTGTAAATSCADVGDDAEFVCETFCDTEACPTNPHPFCEELRAIFTAHTGGAVFPCEIEQPIAAACMGDCGGDGTVDISDLTQCLLIVFGERDAAHCAGARHDGQPMSVGDMVLAVRHALDGCQF